MERLLAEGTPAWTNKEVLYAFGSAAAVLISALVPALVALHRFLSSNLRHRLAVANHEIHELKLKLKPGEGAPSDQLLALLEDAREQIDQLIREKDEAVGDSKEHRMAVEKLRGDLDTIQTNFTSEQRRVERALEAKGFTWTEKVLYSAPAFRSLDERRMPIISVLNLKGGVGKTTLTANLGAALSRRGWKVLLIDLDLQGSLTSLFMAEQDQTVIEGERRFIGDFLARSFDAEFPNVAVHRVG